MRDHQWRRWVCLSGPCDLRAAHHRGDRLLVIKPGHRLAETQGWCRTSPPPSETSITINLRAGAAKSCSANRYGASQLVYWYPDKTSPRRRCNLKVFVVNTFSVFFRSSLVTGLQRRPGAGKSWRRDSVCSRCQPSKNEMRADARQWCVIAENNSKEGNWHRSKKKKIDEGWKRASHIRRFWTFDVSVSWQLLFDSLSVNLLSEAWDTLHDDPVSLSQSWYCTAFGRR